MKIRQGFVSNSSSSSFIVTNASKLNDAIKIIEDYKPHLDYFIFKNKLYTSYLSDCNGFYSSICNNDLFEEYDVGNSTPYEEEEFVEVEGELGLDSVFINREGLTDEDLIQLGDIPRKLSSELYLLLKHYFEGNSEFTKDTILEECKKYFIDDVYED